MTTGQVGNQTEQNIKMSVSQLKGFDCKNTSSVLIQGQILEHLEEFDQQRRLKNALTHITDSNNDRISTLNDDKSSSPPELDLHQCGQKRNFSFN